MSTQLVSLQEKAKQSLKDWDFDVLYQNTIWKMQDCKANVPTEEYLLIEEISDGSAGIYQCEEIITAFHLWDYVDKDGDWWEVVENQWEVIQEFTEILGELITEILRDKYGLKGVYYFTNHPDWGDYGLFYREEEE
jgi:hypothetical protein